MEKYINELCEILDEASENLSPYDYADFLDAAAEEASSRIVTIDYGDDED